MKLLYHNRKRDPDLERELNARWVDKETLLGIRFYLAARAAYRRDRHMIGRREFEVMKDTAVLVNTSRGPVVDEKALVERCAKLIWAAGLDVYEREPEIEEGLKELDNVVLASHIGSATIEARTSMAMMAAQNIVSVLKGGKPITPVNEITVKG